MDMRETAATPTLLLNPALEQTLEIPLGGGRACVAAVPHSAAAANQDSVALLALDDGRAVIAVADGMGGGPAGERASALALQELAAAVERAAANGLALRGGVLDGFEAAHQAIQELAIGAATTLLVAEIQHNTLRTYHAGDSAACLFGRRGKLKLQTDFHSPVGYAQKSGMLDEEAALVHEQRHYVSNMLGLAGMSVQVGSPLPLAPYDTLVLGSDGLFDNLSIAEIGERVRRGAIADAAATLQAKVLERMYRPQAGAPSKPDDLAFVLFRLR